MDDSVKHRIIGSILVISIALIVSPFFIKERKPAWMVMEDKKSFKIPAQPKLANVTRLKPIILEEKPVKGADTSTNNQVLDHIQEAEIAFVAAQDSFKSKTKLAKLNLEKKKTHLASNATVKKSAKGKSTPIDKKVANKGKTYYSIQLATFSSSLWAEKLLSKLKEQGVDGYLNHIVTAKGTNFTQVMSVKLIDKEQVIRLQKKLDSSMNVKSLIIKHG